MNLILELLLEALEPFSRLIDGTDVCLQDNVLRRCGADNFREPSEVGRAPIGPAYRTDILPQ